MLSVGYVARHGLRLFFGLAKLDWGKIKKFYGEARRACCVITVYGAKRSVGLLSARPDGLRLENIP